MFWGAGKDVGNGLACPHLTDEATEAQRGEVACLGSQGPVLETSYLSQSLSGVCLGLQIPLVLLVVSQVSYWSAADAGDFGGRTVPSLASLPHHVPPSTFLAPSPQALGRPSSTRGLWEGG